MLSSEFGERLKILHILNQFPDPVSWHNLDHSVFVANDPLIDIVGFKNLDHLLGITKENYNCKLAECADMYLQEDQLVIDTKETIKSISYECHANDNWRLLLTTKSPIFDSNGKLLGVAQHFSNLTNLNVQKMCMNLSRFDAKVLGLNSAKEYLYTLDPVIPDISISKREGEVLFYYLRGYTANGISKVLFRSRRTIEQHLENLKLKLGCSNKIELIELCINKGLLGYIPSSVLDNKQYLASLETSSLSKVPK